MHWLDLARTLHIIGYPGLFLVVFLESGVFFGFFLPGASMLFTAGLLAAHGYFHPWILIPLVTLAAVLGDSAGYWFGNKVGIRLFLRPNSRFFKHEHLERAKNFYDDHGALAIALARFIPIVRTFAPIVAGVVAMRYRTFLTYNIAGALVWASGVTFLGYILGEKVPGLDRYIGPVILLIIVLTCIPIALEFWKARRSSSEAA